MANNTINASTFSGKKVVLLGMGKSNIAALKFFNKCGSIIETRDIKKPEDSIINEIEKYGANLIYGDNWLDDIDCDYVLRTPAIRPDAVEKKIGSAILTSEMELFCNLCKGHIIAITGSDGKTTTTTIIYQMLKKEFENSSKRVWLGGNIGYPLIEFVDDIKEDDYVVLELSSFQLMDMSKQFEISVVTNVTPNHLNWHASMDEYICSKKNIFKYQDNSKKTILNYDNEVTRKYGYESNAQVKFFSCVDNCDAFFGNGSIFISNEHIIDATDIKIPGKHNAQNYMAAMLALNGIVSKDNMIYVAKNFPGVRHRIELVLENNGIKYINSSIDTSPTRTIAALSCFSGPLVAIVGGYDKHLDMTPLVPHIKEKVHTLICTGDTGESIKNMMITNGYKGHLKYIKEFDDAVDYACQNAKSGDTVLLTPACASFDSFKNFEQRGDHFCDLIKSKYGSKT